MCIRDRVAFAVDGVPPAVDVGQDADEVGQPLVEPHTGQEAVSYTHLTLPTSDLV